jgi:hypothetical protein
MLSGCVKRALLRNQSKETTLVGCLTPGLNPDIFTLADGETGEKTTVTGDPDLALHADNHAVRLIGFYNSHSFRIIWVEHIAASCEVPFR